MLAHCLNCNNEFSFNPHHKRCKYCSNICQGIHKSLERKRMWYEGTLARIDRATMRKYLGEDRGYKCETCGISDWNGKKPTLHVDHKDGNPADDRPVNMRLLCPNCHSQTPFLGNANRGRGRKAQGLRLN